MRLGALQSTLTATLAEQGADPALAAHVETALSQLRALDVEVRRQKSDPAPLATLRTWVTPP